MMHLRQPILLPKKEPLRALIHAWFSTEEQRQSSIDDQVASCRTFLESNLPKGWKPEQVEIDVIAEPEVSGEIADRPGINQVWAGIEAKRWHLIIAEESSRLYRHHTKAGELFESAVDADVRVICTSDYIDTADDDWPDRLHMSQMQHARSNFYTRKRIERAHDGLWARGAAVGNTVIGYKRRPTLPATETEPAKGPFYDEIDEEKAVVIREVFERIAAGETAAEVGEWLDSIKFAKAKWSRQAKWTAGNVNAVIRRTIYRGFETFRKKKAKRKLRTGKSEYVWNDEDKIQTRESPHLRIVSDHLWYGANEVVDKRRVFKKPVRGAGHPLRGTTRQRVVPRLEFTINLVAALPPAVVAPLRQAAGDDAEDEPVAMLKRTLMVNAFDEPQLVKHARVIVEGRLEGKTYKKIAKELNLTEYNMENCTAITRLMEAAGLPEPYRRLKEKPDYVPQWCSKHWLKAGERKGGGKRRRAS